MDSKPERQCGKCSMCCKIPTIKDFAKPYARWCQHCRVGSGCSIYAERPQTCRDFLCAWRTTAHLDDELRPDRCGVVLAPRAHPIFGRALVAMVEKGQWERATKPRMRAFLNKAQQRGFKIFVIDGRDQKQMMPGGSLAPAPSYIDCSMH